jgi:hypothetical protein
VSRFISLKVLRRRGGGVGGFGNTVAIFGVP